MTDEELQHSVEQGQLHESEDARAYRHVFDALKREPDFALPANFDNRVVSRWESAHPQQSHDLFWFYTGIVGCLITMVVAVLLTNFRFSFGAFRFIPAYPGLVVFAVFFVLSLHWLDRRIIRKPA